jgi:hypothetical protein
MGQLFRRTRGPDPVSSGRRNPEKRTIASNIVPSRWPRWGGVTIPEADAVAAGGTTGSYALEWGRAQLNRTAGPESPAGDDY